MQINYYLNERGAEQNVIRSRRRENLVLIPTQMNDWEE